LILLGREEELLGLDKEGFLLPHNAIHSLQSHLNPHLWSLYSDRRSHKGISFCLGSLPVITSSIKWLQKPEQNGFKGKKAWPETIGLNTVYKQLGLACEGRIKTVEKSSPAGPFSLYVCISRWFNSLVFQLGKPILWEMA
jgi:hypothetical protein